MRQLADTSSLRAWRASKPHVNDVTRAVRHALDGVPVQWHQAMAHLGEMRKDAPGWLACLEALDAIREFETAHGNAARWCLSDSDVRDMARRIADEAEELDGLEVAAGASIERRFDTLRMLARVSGVDVAALSVEGSIARMKDETWWRRALRVKVARVVEAGAVKLGIVNARAGGYASNNAVTRRADQLQRNALALSQTFYRNEAGQVYSLAELAAASVSNPEIRGGELMTRIRGAEEYADALGHVGLFVTLTCPSAMHAMTQGSGGRPIKNKRYDGESTPRDGQAWLRRQWSRTRAALARCGVKVYGLRVAEPHHDATPHWHALLWAESEQTAARAESIIRDYWLREYGEERGAEKNRVNVKRMTAGGAAGYVAKYIAKSVGHHVLPDSLDSAQGELLTVEAGDVPGHRRVDAWAATWGIRQFQFIGMPSVTVWRELRRVTSDQAGTARVQWGDVGAWRAWAASGARTLEGLGGVPCWRTFMVAMGGHCLGRGRWALRVARRAEPGRVNRYGEELRRCAWRAVGVETESGRWLVSRRQAWVHVSQREGEDTAARSAAAWTGFNNCTARLTGRMRSALLGLKQGGVNRHGMGDPHYLGSRMGRGAGWFVVDGAGWACAERGAWRAAGD